MSALLKKLAPERTQTGPHWLAGARREARKQLMRHGFPTLKTEDWKYTSLRGLEKTEFDIPENGKGGCFAGEGGESIYLLRWRNDKLIAPEDMPPGIRLIPLSELDEQRGRALIERNFGGPEGAFAWLNTDQFEEGWLLEITESQSQPLILEFQNTGSAVRHPRITINLAPGVEARIVERHASDGGLLNIVMSTRLEAGAQLDYARLQNAAPESFIVQRHDVRIERDARLAWTTLDLNGRLMRHDLNVDLAQTGSECRIDGAFVARGRSHLDHHTRITHTVGRTQSRETFRGILSGHGHGVFNGKIIMAPGADGSDSELNSANLLLSPDARIDTKPELEIHAEEVKAAHGATVGALDETALFYLQSRGLPREQAVSLLKHAFVGEIVEKVSPLALRTVFAEHLKQALGE